MTDSFEDSDNENLHARWREWEERHAKNKVRLYAIVGVTMAAIIVVWFVSLSDMVREVTADNSDVGSLRQQFADEFDSYQRKLDSYLPTAVATGTAPVAAPAVVAGEEADFLGALKTKAAKAAADVAE